MLLVCSHHAAGRYAGMSKGYSILMQLADGLTDWTVQHLLLEARQSAAAQAALRGARGGVQQARAVPGESECPRKAFATAAAVMHLKCCTRSATAGVLAGEQLLECVLTTCVCHGQVFEYLSTDLKKYMDRNGKGPSNPMHPDVVKVTYQCWILTTAIVHLLFAAE